MKHQTILLWFRRDLRLHDHEPLFRAWDQGADILPVYVIDPREFGETPFGFAKTGPFRARFLKESLLNLQARLRARGSDLIVLAGQPETLLPDLARQTGATAIFAHKEVTSEETHVEAALEQALFAQGIGLELFWGSTLYHLNDLPMPVQSLPEIFTQFRKQVEKMAGVRPVFETPGQLSLPPAVPAGLTPEAWGLEGEAPDARAVLPFAGGEEAGLARLQDYLWEGDHLRRYKETRNGLLGADYSSKFSAWLALGCLSPRQIYAEVKRYEQLRVKNASTYWLIFELIWRDYFRFVAKKHGNRLFFPGGLKGDSARGRQDDRLFRAWQQGQTGIPFVDANMRELWETGFMSNRGRQNVASFLVRDLGLDWRLGAEWFESQLVDYDVCSNWGNWNYVAGIGNDPRENRYFNVVSQGKRYDPKGDYLRHWLPELAALPAAGIHEPYAEQRRQLAAAGVHLGGNYPHPVVSMDRRRSRA
ncbi:MAG: DASH family cryptochrome [Bacteroidetes bacterium]|nr:MAG: DASH family cryptochrome [Bacteroidota bacterium]